MPKAQSTISVFGVDLDVEYEYEPRELPTEIDPGWPVVLLDYNILDSTDLTGVEALDLESAFWHRGITRAIIQQIEYGN